MAQMRGAGVEGTFDEPMSCRAHVLVCRSGRLSNRPSGGPTGKSGEPAGWKACPTPGFMAAMQARATWLLPMNRPFAEVRHYVWLGIRRPPEAWGNAGRDQGRRLGGLAPGYLPASLWDGPERFSLLFRGFCR